tara:strand:+ start:280 stop:510 length:231 start_codon:yes stop_codon:yes gene_type:complete
MKTDDIIKVVIVFFFALIATTIALSTIKPSEAIYPADAMYLHGKGIHLFDHFTSHPASTNHMIFYVPELRIGSGIR